ncbi:MAG TPA: glycosyltransferase [Mycobacteriales bacterium]|nr:glycosyltransferase [Mycobacteriales bacterium]
MTPTVSVLVSSYNYGRFIGAALASVRAQTVPDFEAVVVDDGSTDDTFDVLADFLRDPRFQLVRQEHGGPARAKSAGILWARGEYLAFLDADDVWEPTKLERQLGLFAADPRLGIVFTRRLFIDPDGRPVERLQPTGPNRTGLGELFRDNFICFSSAMLRRTVAEHVGLFDVGLPLALDYDFWLRAARRYRIGCIDEPLTAYRIGHGNLSRRITERLHAALFIMQRFRRHYGGRDSLDPDVVRRSEAETFAHLGVVSRGHSRTAALRPLLRALTRDPLYPPAWRGLLHLVTPDHARRLIRRLLGRSGAWEQHCFSAANRPDPVH